MMLLPLNQTYLLNPCCKKSNIDDKEGGKMLKELVKKGRVTFYKGFQTWEGAIAAACQPLIADGAITLEYVDSVIKCIKEHGPYIVIAPNICIPHFKQGASGVNETAISFMKTDEPVHFSDNPEHDARLFFVLASIDHDQHFQNLQELVELISDETVVEKLLAAKSVEDINDIG